MPDFQITTRGFPARPEEWLFSKSTPESELPPLSAEDKERARIRHLTDEQYARHKVLKACARRRESEEAEQIGEIIQSLFRELGGRFKLNGIVKRGFEPGWRALIESHSPGAGWKFFDVSLPTEDFSDVPDKQVLNASSPDQIRAHLLKELNLGEGQRVAS